MQFNVMYIKKLRTFVRKAAFSKHVQQFHRAPTKHYSQGANTSMIQLKWKLSVISMLLDCLDNSTKAL